MTPRIGAGRVGTVVAARLRRPCSSAAARSRPRRLQAAPDRDPRRRHRRGVRSARAAARPGRRRRPLLGRRPACTPSTPRRRRGRACTRCRRSARRGPDQLEGAFAAVTGDWELGAGLARELGMTPFALADEAKPVYHAASRLRLELPGHAHARGGGAARAQPASSASRRCRRCGRCSSHGRASPARPPPGRSPAATRPPSRRTCEAVGPRAAAALPRRWGRATLPLVLGPRVADRRAGAAVKRRAGADDGRAARRPPGAAARRSGRVRPGGDEPVREPDPVRAGRGLRPLPARRGRRDRAIAAAEGVDEVYAPTVDGDVPGGV